MAPQQPLVLVVESEHATQELIGRALTPYGFRVRRAANGLAALALCEQEDPDLIVLDLRLPGLGGSEVCRRIRQRSRVPILVLANVDATTDTMNALDLGADDYLAMPFGGEELLVRVRALLRRAGRQESPSLHGMLRFDRLAIDLHDRRLLRDGQAVRLSRTEWALLETLARNAGQVLTHRMLLQRVWGDSYGAESGYLYTYIRRLRHKLEDDPARPRYLLTEPGIGYRFALPEAAVAAEARSARPTSTRPPLAPTNLPAQPTALIGRAQEVAAVCALLRRSDVRLVTLTGSPGMGKTRLGLQVAADLHADFAQRVVFVALASIRDPDLVASTIAQALGVQEAGSQPLIERLKDYLRDQQLLLLLDNFEQVLAAAPLLAALLAAAPQLKVLATSRAVLHLYGEHEFVVPAMALPDLGQLPPLETLGHYAAVALFAARAQAVRPSFTLTAENAHAVATICARLDGMPLAIELAAARSKVLPPQAILARLDSRLSMLVGGARDQPGRQQSLRSTLDWSYELLDVSEQRLFARLGVFVGGCTPEAAEAICESQNPKIEDRRSRIEDRGWKIDPRSSILHGLAALVDKSLLGQEVGAEGEVRFTMLATIREYAIERLAASEEAETLRRVYAGYYLALAERAEPEIRGSQQGMWLDRLEAEHDNLRTALGWLLERAEPEPALQLGAALWRFWWIRGHLSEGRRWLEAALALGGARATAPRAQALNGAGVLAHNQGDFAQARAFYEQSLAIYQELGHKPGIAGSLNHLGLAAYDRGAYAAATPLFEESLALFRELGDKQGVCSTLSNLGLVAMEQGDFAQAKICYEEVLTLQRELGDQHALAMSLNNLGCVVMEQEGDFVRAAALFEESQALFHELGDKGASIPLLDNLGLLVLYQGQQARARAFFEEGLALSREVGDRWGMALFLDRLGVVTWHEGHTAQAGLLFQESLALRRELDDRRGVAGCLEGFAGLAAPGQPLRAARLWGAAEALREALGTPRPPAERSLYDRALAAAHVQLGDTAWAAARAEGRAMSLQQAIALALDHTVSG